jgi:hypothetical protein
MYTTPGANLEPGVSLPADCANWSSAVERGRLVKIYQKLLNYF